MYMNALKMIVAPVVFFSIISCIVQFSSLTELGRIGGKVVTLYAVVCAYHASGLFDGLQQCGNTAQHGGL
jgi:Na+/H+-dicarboxylate symporter